MAAQETAPGVGRNSGAAPKVGGIDSERLCSLVGRVEALMTERAQVNELIRDVYTEAKSAGFTPKTLRRVIRERAQDEEKRAQEQEEFDLYCHALGM